VQKVVNNRSKIVQQTCNNRSTIN